ncbi:MAG TPA: Gfo/Idh/MocA family oxidoreductase [Candidatus Limiplasma stercoravium]|nr:Gfo/Idh/MocA family oxidoreductase [Candidatus Limiplasma stercoravium]
MKQIRFGVIGCGLMGREFASASMRWLHLKDALPRPVILAACDTSEENREWFRRVPDTVFFYSDYHELLQNPEIDAVYCALPHNLHARVYADVIRAGKHLLGEKPFGLDLPACEEILQAVKENPGVFVRCASEFPYYPAVQQMIRWYREGAFGQIIEARFAIKHSSDMDLSKPINWKRMRAVNGEYGCMGDLGIHTQHLPFRLGFQPQNVRSVLANIVKTRLNADGQPVPCETWDNALLLCEAKNDAGDAFPMQLEMKRMAPGCSNTVEYEIYGLNMSARFTTDDPNAISYTVSHGREQGWTRLGVGQKPLFPVITGSIFEFGFSDAILQMFAAFTAELSGETVSFGCFTPQEALQSHRMLTAALRSYERGEAVAL